MTATARPRTAARVGAVQALFQSEQAGETAETVIDQFVRHRLGRLPDSDGFAEGRVPDADVRLFGQIVRTASQKQDQLDGLVADALPADWPFTRLDPVLRALLRAACAELSLEDGPPVRVVINEYLDVAHGFFDGDEPRLVNGLLDRVARTLRPEFAAEPQ
jgi:N utilization substance protein B